jgi:hypothetical protein
MSKICRVGATLGTRKLLVVGIRVLVPINANYAYICNSFIHQWLYIPLLGCGRYFNFVILYTICRNPWTRDQPISRRLPTHRRAQTQNKCTHTFMSRMDIEPTTPVFEREKTVLALDRTTTVISICNLYLRKFNIF